MGAFGGLIITNRGRALQAKAQLGTQLTFTRIGIGDGELGGSSIVDLTALKHEVKSLSLTKMKLLSDGKALIGAILSNQDITTGFYFRELGVFAQDPDLGEILYCYGNAGATAEYIPAGGGPDIVEKNIDIITIVGNASSVNAVIDESLVFETPTGAQEKADTAESNAKAYTDQQVAARVLNAGNVPSIQAGPDTSKPAPGTAGRLYIATDTKIIYQDTGAAWEKRGVVNWNDIDGKPSSFTPSAHKSTHATGGADQLTPADIGAAAASDFNAHLADYVRQIPYAVASGSANSYAVTLSPAPGSYTEGLAIAVKINVDNTGPSTLNVNGLGAKAIKKPNGADVSAGNLKAGSVYTVRYNGSNFILQGEYGGGNAQPADVLSGKTFTNDLGPQTGTMPNQGAVVITPTTVNQTIAQGYHNGSGYVTGDANLIPGNIKAGVSIFGVAGTVNPLRVAYGDATLYNGGNASGWQITVSGLAFAPQFVIGMSVAPDSGQYDLIGLIIRNSTYAPNTSWAMIGVCFKSDSASKVYQSVLTDDGFTMVLPLFAARSVRWIAIG